MREPLPKSGVCPQPLTHSNPALLGNPHSRSLLMNLRKSRLREVCQVVQLIDRHNAGLEQEALLIPGSY
jgi:hypothetical protein